LISFETNRLLIRILEIEDLDSVMRFWGNAEVMKYCGGSSCDRERIANAIRNYRNSQEQRGFSAFAVVLKETSEVIGACGYNYTKDKDVIELIYHFAKKYWDKGYATETGEACINYAKEHLKIHKIIASVDPKHAASRKILEKLKFVYKDMKWFKETEQYDMCFELTI